MSDNQLINQSLAANNDWMFLALAVIIGIVALFSHFNRLREDKCIALAGERWIVANKWIVCRCCMEKYKQANITIEKLSNEYSHHKCADCKCTHRN